MKNAIKNLVLSAIVLCLAYSFANAPVSAGAATAEATISTPLPVGGAYLMFAGKYGGSITKKEMEGQNQLGVDGCARGSKIFQYTLEVSKGGKTSSHQADSNVLTKEMVTQLKSLSAGDSFEFKKIKAHLPNKKDVVDVHSKKFVVA